MTNLLLATILAHMQAGTDDQNWNSPVVFRRLCNADHQRRLSKQLKRRMTIGSLVLDWEIQNAKEQQASRVIMNSIKEEEQKAANPEEETMAQQQWVEYCQHGTMPKHLTQVYKGIALKRSNSSVQVGNVLETRNVALRRGVVAMVYFTVASQLASWKENLRKTKTKRFGTGNWFTKQKPNDSKKGRDFVWERFFLNLVTLRSFAKIQREP